MVPAFRFATALLLPLTAVPAQHAVPARRDTLAAMATLLSSTATPAVAGRARTEVQITQPMLSLRGGRRDGALQYALTANGEFWTMRNGEPVAGIWGEGFLDRRHPHTIVHEAMLTGSRRLGSGWRMSLAAGRGFVPFGTDDPMFRPMTKFPANHHLSQVMERLQVIAVLRLRNRAAVELVTFNGDEPLGPTTPPQWSRFGDSRSVRVTTWITPALELQGSAAFVRSPEFVRAEGLDHAKRSLSARFAPRRGALRYALVEWSRTTESYASRPIIAYGSGLAEAQWHWLAWSAAVRAEQTTRPEDERLLDPFRTPRPPNHLVIKGMTRWRIASLQVARALPPLGRVHGSLFTEAGRAVSSPQLRPVLLDPRDVIGADAAWHFALGLRAGVGAMSARGGRYGAAAGPASGVLHGMHGMDQVH